MSALREGEPIEKDGKRVHSFRQPVPIPSYLIAIVTGELQSRQIGPRTHVWAEPDVVDEAAYEFADVCSIPISFNIFTFSWLIIELVADGDHAEHR